LQSACRTAEKVPRHSPQSRIEHLWRSCSCSLLLRGGSTCVALPPPDRAPRSSSVPLPRRSSRLLVLSLPAAAYIAARPASIPQYSTLLRSLQRNNFLESGVSSEWRQKVSKHTAVCLALSSDVKWSGNVRLAHPTHSGKARKSCMKHGVGHLNCAALRPAQHRGRRAACLSGTVESSATPTHPLRPPQRFAVMQSGTLAPSRSPETVQALRTERVCSYPRRLQALERPGAWCTAAGFQQAVCWCCDTCTPSPANASHRCSDKAISPCRSQQLLACPSGQKPSPVQSAAVAPRSFWAGKPVTRAPGPAPSVSRQRCAAACGSATAEARVIRASPARFLLALQESLGC